MKWVLMNGCGHIEQPGRNKDVETSRYIETGACLIISVQRDISVRKVNVLLLHKFVLILVIKPKEKDC